MKRDNMMDAELEKAIALACLKAIEALGDKHMGLSCFLFNGNLAQEVA